MAKQTYTPGPWEFVKSTTRGEFGVDYKIRAADDSAIATIGPCAQDANARLIALAPEMAEALRLIDGILDGWDGDVDDDESLADVSIWPKDYKKLRAILAKLESET